MQSAAVNLHDDQRKKSLEKSSARQLLPELPARHRFFFDSHETEQRRPFSRWLFIGERALLPPSHPPLRQSRAEQSRNRAETECTSAEISSLPPGDGRARKKGRGVQVVGGRLPRRLGRGRSKRAEIAHWSGADYFCDGKKTALSRFPPPSSSAARLSCARPPRDRNISPLLRWLWPYGALLCLRRIKRCPFPRRPLLSLDTRVAFNLRKKEALA